MLGITDWNASISQVLQTAMLRFPKDATDFAMFGIIWLYISWQRIGGASWDHHLVGPEWITVTC